VWLARRRADSPNTAPVTHTTRPETTPKRCPQPAPAAGPQQAADDDERVRARQHHDQHRGGSELCNRRQHPWDGIGQAVRCAAEVFGSDPANGGSELSLADEVFFLGTGWELQPLTEIDSLAVGGRRLPSRAQRTPGVLDQTPCRRPTQKR
jgi:hypothetical protein